MSTKRSSATPRGVWNYTLLGRWVPANAYPQSAGGNNVVVVQLQRQYCDSTTRCQSNDPRAITRPGEVLTSGLLARIEQRYLLTSVYICCVHLGALVFVASSTGQPQILCVGQATACDGNDMFNCEGLPSDKRRSHAIAATVPCLPFESSQQLGR